MKRSLLLVFIAFFLFGSVASAAKLRLHIPLSTSWSGHLKFSRIFFFRVFLEEEFLDCLVLDTLKVT